MLALNDEDGTSLQKPAKVWLLLYAHRHLSILGVAGHITLAQANQLMVMGLKIWSPSKLKVERYVQDAKKERP
jgi:hypothetical protein